MTKETSVTTKESVSLSFQLACSQRIQFLLHTIEEKEECLELGMTLSPDSLLLYSPM